MRKLLSANFSRLRKDKSFWLCMGTMLVYSVAYMLNGCRQASTALSEYNYSIDEYYFHFTLSIGMFCALFGSMFLGTEYNDGTIRNKIIVGHTRTDIYIANYLLTFSAVILMEAVWLVGALIAVPTLGIWRMDVSTLLVYLLLSLMLAAAFSAIFTFAGMLSSNKAVAVVISVLLFLGLLLFSSMVYEGLSQPEMISDIVITADGMSMGDPAPNPYYISGIQREIFDFIVNFLPTGQGLRIWQLEVQKPALMLVSSVFITAAVTLGGILAFKRKNLK